VIDLYQGSESNDIHDEKKVYLKVKQLSDRRRKPKAAKTYVGKTDQLEGPLKASG
jgi:hypothetical protein